MMRAMAELQVLERDAPLADVMAAYDADGGVIVRDLLSDDARRAIVEDLSAGLEDTAPGSKSGMDLWETFHGRNTVRFCGLAARSRHRSRHSRKLCSAAGSLAPGAHRRRSSRPCRCPADRS